MLRVVLDTNIYLSFLCKPDGTSGQLFSNKFSNKYKICTSSYILEEIYNVGHRDAFRKFFPAYKVSELIYLLKTITTFIKINKVSKVEKLNLKRIIPDDSDFEIYLTFIQAKANYLVTGNKKHFKIKEAISPNEFLKILEKVK